MTFVTTRNRERLALMALVAFCVLAFIAIAHSMAAGTTRSFDEGILLLMRTTGEPANPVGSWWLEVMMSDLTSLGSVAVLVLLSSISGGYFLLTRRYIRFALVIGSFLGAQAANTVLKYFFARPRPSVIAHLGEVHTLSFPSGHAMMSAVIYLTIGILLASTRTQRSHRYYIMSAAIVLTVIVGFSRVYLGVHYPTDVVAGWAAGVAWACVCWLVVSSLEGRPA
jgi:undecaprenyl-diphosphatase